MFSMCSTVTGELKTLCEILKWQLWKKKKNSQGNCSHQMKKNHWKWINTAFGVESSPSPSFSVFLLNLLHSSLCLLLVPSAYTHLHRGKNRHLQGLKQDFDQHVDVFSFVLLCCGDFSLPEKLCTQSASCRLLFQLYSLRCRAISEIRADYILPVYIIPGYGPGVQI